MTKESFFSPEPIREEFGCGFTFTFQDHHLIVNLCNILLKRGKHQQVHEILNNRL